MLGIWATALGLTVWGTRRSLKHLGTPPPHLDTPFNLFPVTVLKPLKGAESGIRENLESFFRLDYPKYEILFSVADERDPAFDLVSELIRKHPGVPARLIVGDVQAGPNPKINNLVKSYQQARYDWLLISDSNVRVRPDYLTRLVAHLDAGVGIMTSLVAGQNAQGLGGHLEAGILNTFYARGMVQAFAVGHPIVMGKSMMFRKSTAERFGGIKVLARYLAEDYIAGEAVRHLGLRTVLAHDPIVQHIGNYSVRDFWLRHLRWGRIRKVQSPLTFFIEPVFGCMISGVLGAMSAMQLWGTSPAIFMALHLTAWSCCDFQMMRRMGQKTDVRLPVTWFVRELITLPLWAHIASGNTVNWRGRKLRLQPGGMLEAK